MNTQFSNPDPGCKVAITFEFPSYVIGQLKVNKTTITGIVEKATKFTPPNFVRIVTDFDSPVRTREIALDRVIDIVYADGRIASKTQTKNQEKIYSVDGSRGSKYVVINSNNAWSCTCPGFQFRQSCKHINELKGN
jgi:hypothetical protein